MTRSASKTTLTAILETLLIFLQIKNPVNFIELSTLGRNLGASGRKHFWVEFIINQAEMVGDKRIRHRNLGVCSEHNCGYENCHLNGLMIRPVSVLKEGRMHFDKDKNRYSAGLKSQRSGKERIEEKKIIEKLIEEEC